ncbi:MAG TPA: hypothetical protein VFV78_09845 [Vicinamibacterales bacterium]|nr:hypothetical protein [Vicinamibacterales bacterium]
MALEDFGVLLPSVACVNCSEQAARLLEISQLAPVDYYRCTRCAHLWTVYKGTRTLVEHVTVPTTPGRIQDIKPRL